MRRKTIFLLVGLLLAVSVTVVLADSLAETFEIPWWSVAGSGTSQGGAYSLSGSTGQANTGSASGGNYTLIGGFWSITQQESNRYLYLPLVNR